MRNASIQELMSREDYPSVSIFMPTHRAHPETQQDPIRLKNLLNEARQRLDAEIGKRPSWPIVDQLERLAETIDWRENQDGLALFASEDYATTIRLPFVVAERVAVDRTFETRDIVAALHRLPRYLVLTLAPQATRLFAATGTDLEQVAEYGFPVKSGGAAGATRGPDGAQMARSTVREGHLQDIYRDVDAALTEALAAEPLPVVLIGARPTLSSFDDVSSHGDRIIARIEGSHAEANAAAIAQLAWPEVQQWRQRQRASAVEEVSIARGANLLAAGLDDAWHAARAGRGARLVVEQDYRQSAIVNRESGAIQLVSSPTDAVGPQHLDDAVDELAEVVLGMGGEVVFVDEGALAGFGRIALVLRH